MFIPIRFDSFAIVFAFVALLQDGAMATPVGTVTRRSNRYSLQRRQGEPEPLNRGAGCGQIKQGVPDFGGQCICFNPDTVAVFGETQAAVDFANANDYTYPQSTSNNGNCNFPPGGSITLLPYSGNCCGYECTYGSCGSGSSLVCLEQGQGCQSGTPVPAPVTKRQLRGRECPAGLTSCAVTSTGGQQFYECIDTQKDLESCGGGCMNPDVRYGNSTASGKYGQDCSAIPDAADVSCQQGLCVVAACDSAYELVEGQCI